MTVADERTAVARLTLAAVGSVALGQAAYLSTWLAVGLIGTWLHYVATTPPARVAALLVLGIGTGLIARATLGVWDVS